MNRAKIIWSSIFLAIGVVFILVGLALWFSLFLLWGPPFSVEVSRSYGASLFMPGFLFLVLGWSVASGLSGRVLRVCFFLGIVSFLVSEVLWMAHKIEMSTGIFVIWAAWGLIGGSVLALFYKVHYRVNGTGNPPPEGSGGGGGGGCPILFVCNGSQYVCEGLTFTLATMAQTSLQDTS